MPNQQRQASASQIRYGLGEWYGRPFTSLTAQERSDFAAVSNPRSMPCPPRSTEANPVACTKKGGVCSLRLYERDKASGVVSPAVGVSSFCTLCPHRFKEADRIFTWVGDIVLGDREPLVATEVEFLKREQASPNDLAGDTAPSVSTKKVQGSEREDVGQIDYVLVHHDRNQLNWCAMELQAVYFSGEAMSNEYNAIRTAPDGILPFPVKVRRPDYRSSGPKRLMPQLQIKVPTLRRWGKKMAVVVDHNFFSSLGVMDHVPDISNCDIVWFVMDYAEIDGQVQLVPQKTQFTTLERAVEGLTAGKPVSQTLFEKRINEKLEQASRPKSQRRAKDSA